MNNQLKEIGYNAKKTLGGLQKLGSSKKNDALLQVARGLLTDTDEIIKANENDMAHGRENHMPQGLLDRLQLTPERISQMSEGLEQIASLEDPIG